ncbi:sigma-54-dependent transcriptional regulator [Poritiphilus flavus]|uniref:Response regulator n=1 Tax=Poritiphilus flavus TaxID=2697053 RepID=A0A6L9EDK8_9FLAO|nr:sigma-54 dependent transcriptional regulator [Poritiphilus flavus]NAS12648.1 response regulator [Poritiphilus flavus]
MPNILIIEDDAAFCQMLQRFLTKKGYEVQSSFTAPDAKEKYRTNTFDLVLTDLRLPDCNGIQLLADIKATSPQTAVVLMTGYAEVGSAVEAMKQGAADYISKPFTPEEVVEVIENALKPEKSSKNSSKNPKKQESQKTTENFTMINGISEASKKTNEYIKLVAPTDMSVLITGESGTGKEVSARAIHNNSPRKDFMFVAVDCGAIPKELATSEFFGHVKGSFTGAIEDKVGHFEAANGGTLFLDEVGNLSYENQIQLLRALQERKIKRVGSTREVAVDVRIITATNEDLQKAVEKGVFREDLYHRLNEFSIAIPSLKERKDDILLFANLFLDKANQTLGKKILGFSDEVTELFYSYRWPGNLRELKNVIKRAVLLSSGETVNTEVLPGELLQPQAEEAISADEFSRADYEKEQIIKALKQTNFNKSKAAKLLRVTRKTLYNKINYYKLDF